THDQEEALSLSDRIAVMSGGHVLQTGAPREIYDRPSSLKVARFIGEGTFLRGTVEAGGVTLKGSGFHIAARGAEAGLSGEVWLGVRPQDVSLAPGADG